MTLTYIVKRDRVVREELVKDNSVSIIKRVEQEIESGSIEGRRGNRRGRSLNRIVDEQVIDEACRGTESAPNHANQAHCLPSSLSLPVLLRGRHLVVTCLTRTTSPGSSNWRHAQPLLSLNLPPFWFRSVGVRSRYSEPDDQVGRHGDCGGHVCRAIGTDEHINS
jgi:hypothetical protein